MISDADRDRAIVDLRRVFGRCAALAKTVTGIEVDRLAERCAIYLDRQTIAGDRTVATVARYAVEQVEHVQTTTRARVGVEVANYVCSVFRGAIGRPEAMPRVPDLGVDWAAENAQIARTLRECDERATRDADVRAGALPAAELVQRIGVASALLRRPDFDHDAPVGVMRTPIRQRRARSFALPRRGPGTVVDAIADALETQGHFFVPPADAHGEGETP